MLYLIAATNKHGSIGLKGVMPWHVREDLLHFKKTTLNQTVLMGRKTYENLPKKLSGRTIRVVSRNTAFVNSVADLDGFLKEHARTQDIIYVAGGGQLYTQSLPYAKRLILSFVDNDVLGDAFFPGFSLNDFGIIHRKEYATFTQITYEKVGG